MSVSGIGKLAGKAAGAVGEVIGTGAYPESEYALAAYLFDRIVQAERDTAEKDREYYLSLMRACLAAVRGAGSDD